MNEKQQVKGKGTGSLTSNYCSALTSQGFGNYIENAQKERLLNWINKGGLVLRFPIYEFRFYPEDITIYCMCCCFFCKQYVALQPLFNYLDLGQTVCRYFQLTDQKYINVMIQIVARIIIAW